MSIFNRAKVKNSPNGIQMVRDLENNAVLCTDKNKLETYKKIKRNSFRLNKLEEQFSELKSIMEKILSEVKSSKA